MIHMLVSVPLAIVTALAACTDANPQWALPTSALSKPIAPQERAMPVHRVDQTSPPGSRVRSPALDQALSANSNAALIMFLLKRPGDPFLKDARTHLKARLIPDNPAALHAAAGAQADVVAAFDAARLTGTDAAWTGFLARYKASPLADEVANFR